MAFTKDFIRKLPKVLLHDHLDGGVRPQTIIDLANANGYGALPSTDPNQLAAEYCRTRESAQGAVGLTVSTSRDTFS